MVRCMYHNPIGLTYLTCVTLRSLKVRRRLVLRKNSLRDSHNVKLFNDDM